MIAIIVHFHYRWNKVDEIRRNRTAAAEHLEIIEAVLAGDGAAATAALDRHLMTAYRTLIASVWWSTEDSVVFVPLATVDLPDEDVRFCILRRRSRSNLTMTNI